jgi:hypothetical protein
MSDDQISGWEREFVEAGAALEHERWARWQAYLFSRCIRNTDGSMTMSREDVEHWQRQIETPYSQLSETEKESDRKESRSYLSLVRAAISRANKKA